MIKANNWELIVTFYLNPPGLFLRLYTPLLPLSKIRNNGPKSITINSNAENHVRFHKNSVNFREYNFFADVSPICECDNLS